MIEKIFQKDEKVFILFYALLKIPLALLASLLGFITRFNDLEIANMYIFPSIMLAIFVSFIELIFNRKIFYEKNYKVLINEIIYYFFAISILIMISAAFKTTSLYSRSWLLYMLISFIILLIIYKMVFNFFYSYLIKSNIFTKNVFIIGDFSEIKKLIYKFQDNEKYHIRLIGLKKITKENKLYPIQCIELNNSIFDQLNYFEISQIWILNDGSINLDKVIEFFNETPIDIRTVMPEKFHSSKYIAKIDNYNFYETNMSPFNGINYLIKLFFDKLLAILFLLISTPFILIALIFLFIEDGRPLFFVQKRHGWDGRIINILKIRSLKSSNSKFQQVVANDARVLRTGKIIRRLSIDEMPQFFNVLLGDLSIVGPRPHPIDLNNEFASKIKGYMQRHRCKPGITGLAQINGYRGPTTDSKLMEKRYEFDLEYIKKWNPLLDLLIIIKTIFVFLFQKVD